MSKHSPWVDYHLKHLTAWLDSHNFKYEVGVSRKSPSRYVYSGRMKIRISEHDEPYYRKSDKDVIYIQERKDYSRPCYPTTKSFIEALEKAISHDKDVFVKIAKKKRRKWSRT